jgi:hypothetical protein
MTAGDPLRTQVEQALLAALADYGLLTTLTRAAIYVILSENTSPRGTLRETVADLVAWAIAQQRLPVLVAAALELNPGNPALQAVAAQDLAAVPPVRPARPLPFMALTLPRGFVPRPTEFDQLKVLGSAW